VAACDALRALLRDHYTRLYGARQPGNENLNIALRLRVDPAQAWQVAFDPPFDAQIEGQLADAQARWAVYARGRVYCFRCASAACEHSVPPDALHVFRGYGSTGQPEWCEFVQALIDARDVRVDGLYADPPQVFARMQTGHALRTQQLSSFGRASHTYSILAQVVAGYLRLPPAWAKRAAGVDRLALTVQAVETRGARGQIALALNRIAGGIAPDDLDELLLSDWQTGLTRALESATRRADSLQQRLDALGAEASPTALHDCLRDVPAILRRLGRDIERGVRQGERRTRHAEQRRQQQRPIHKALEDARVAALGSVFFDERKGTFVVCGKQNRAHAFSLEGKHVTSFVLQSGGADFRVRTQRWRPLDADELARFRASLPREPPSAAAADGLSTTSGG
jgi:hypothetical protein